MLKHLKLRIGDFVLDPSRNLLTGADGETALEPKVVDVLMTLAAQPRVVLSRDELIDAVWKTEFGADERLTRAISLLRKAFGDERGAARYIETVPKRGYRLIAAVENGGATDNAPLSAEAPAAPVNTPTAASQSRPAWQVLAAIGLAAMLVVAVIAVSTRRNPDPMRGPALVAVIPFDDLSETHDDKVFAGGVSEEILYALSKSSDIRVAARSSSFAFTTRQADEAAKALAATHLVEGTVRKIGENVRVAVSLTDAQNKTVVWSETFERPRTLLVQVQNDIAWRVADALGARLVRNPESAVLDPETYDRYLRARDLLRQRREVVRATKEFETVVERAPNFFRAWAGLAVTHHLRANWSKEQTGKTSTVLEAAAQKAIDRTLELDPRNGEALGVMAMRMNAEGRFREAEALYDRALASEPNNATLLNWRSQVYGSVGRLRAAQADVTRARELDRLSPAYAYNVTLAFIIAGRFAEAKAMLDASVVEQEWDGSHVLDLKRDLLAASGDWHALARYMREPQFAPPARHAETYGLIGATATALAEKKPIDRAVFRQRWKEIVAQHWFVRLTAVEYLTYVGDFDGALEQLEALHADPERWLEIGDVFRPYAAPLRRDRRMIALFDKAGLWNYWRETDRWPDFCREKGLPYDCKIEAARLVEEKSRAASKAVR